MINKNISRTYRFAALLLTAAFAGGQAPPADIPRAPVASVPADDGQWTMPAKNFASTRFSELTEITPANVAQLQVAFTFSIGVNKGQEAPAIVAGDTMFLVSPYPNTLYALDLTQ